MAITELSRNDSALLDRALARFRNVTVTDTAGFLADPATVVMVALDDAGDVTGWAWGTRQRHPCGYSQLMLYEIEVAEQARRQGIGSKLMAAVLQLARQEGQAYVYLSTEQDNLPAQALYRSAGGTAKPGPAVGFSWDLR